MVEFRPLQFFKRFQYPTCLFDPAPLYQVACKPDAKNCVVGEYCRRFFEQLERLGPLFQVLPLISQIQVDQPITRVKCDGLLE